MTKISLNPESMLAGARQAGVLAEAVESAGQRIAALPMPEGTPPGVAGQLRGASAQLHRASRSLASQRAFLTFRAFAARFADGPLGPLLAALCPPLTSPFEMPPLKLHPLKPPKRGFPDNLLHGLESGVKGTGKFFYGAGKRFVNNIDDLVKLVQISQALPNSPQGVWTMLQGSRDPRNKMRDDYLKGLWYGVRHPGALLKSMKDEALASDIHKKDGHAAGAGANAMDILLLFVGVGEVSAAGKLGKGTIAVQRAGAMEQRAATKVGDAAHALDIADHPVHPRTGESPQLTRFRERMRDDNVRNAQYRREQARLEHEATQQRLQEATQSAEDASRRLREGLREAREPWEIAKSVGENAGTNAVTRGNDDDLQHPHAAKGAR